MCNMFYSMFYDVGFLGVPQVISQRVLFGHDVGSYINGWRSYLVYALEILIRVS